MSPPCARDIRGLNRMSAILDHLQPMPLDYPIIKPEICRL
jgi:hypothetical protein